MERKNKKQSFSVRSSERTAFFLGIAIPVSYTHLFLQFMIERLFASSAPAETASDEEEAEDGRCV